MKVEKLSNTRARFTFEVTADEFEHGLEHAFEHIKNDVEIKGFRKGHITRAQYENKFGVESLYQEALNHVLHHKYHEIVAYKDVEVVGEPKVDVDFAAIKKGVPFEVSIETPIKPEIVVDTYKGIEVAKVDTKVTDEEITEAIDQLLEQNVSLIPVEGKPLEMGHVAIFDFDGSVDGVPFEGGKAENHQLEIGSNQFIPGFEEGMVGLEVGQEKDVEVTFPETYHAENLAGKQAVFKVKLHEIKEKKAPEFNEEFVISLSREGVETVEALKEDVKKQILTQKEAEAKSKIAEEALAKIAETVEVDLPKEMIDYEVEQAKKNIENQAKQYGIDFDMYVTLSGLDKDTLMKQLEDQAYTRIINSLIIETVAKKENIQASQDEVDAKYAEISKHYQMPLEEIKKYVQEDMVLQDITFNKALDLIIDNVVQK